MAPYSFFALSSPASDNKPIKPTQQQNMHSIKWAFIALSFSLKTGFNI
jgi:hypothetical protein